MRVADTGCVVLSQLNGDYLEGHREVQRTSCSGCDDGDDDQFSVCLLQSAQSGFRFKFTRGYYRLDWVEITDESGDVIELDSLSASYQLDHTAHYVHSNDYNDLAEPVLLNGVRKIMTPTAAFDVHLRHDHPPIITTLQYM